jgi:general stress protein 26
MGEIKHLNNSEAIAKLKELAEGIGTCMFCTELAQAPFNTRPMAVREVDEAGDIWFISNAESNKNHEIKQDDKVQLIFAKNSSAHYLSVFGEADIFKDKEKMDEVWTPIAKAWFEEGKNDPDATLIRVRPSETYYWDTVDGKIFTLIQIVISAVTGKEMDGGVEGNLNV